MTKALEDFFNLPKTAKKDDDDDFEEDFETANSVATIEEMKNAIESVDKIDLALPMVKNLEASDRDMDELAALAKEKFHDLMDLGMNVEPRFSGPILQTASTLLGHAITAKQAKIDKKLKMIELQLKKAKLDQTTKKSDDNSDTSNGIVLDRNELIKTIIATKKEEKITYQIETVKKDPPIITIESEEQKETDTGEDEFAEEHRIDGKTDK